MIRYNDGGETMDDKSLILQALQMGAPPKQKRKRLRPVFEDSFDVGPDAIYKPKKSKPKPKPDRAVGEWKGSDFVNYFSKCLSQFGLTLETNQRDYDWIMKVYDALVDEFSGSMNNYVLRDYIDWWVGCHASTHQGREIGVFSLHKGYDIDRFVKHYALRAGKPQGKRKVDLPKVDISAEEMYKMSGLTMVLMEFGIAEAYRVMVDKGEVTIFARISDALKNCSKDAVVRILDRTMARRYNPKYVVDFMSVARPALKFHRLEKQFDHVDYKTYFTEA